MSTQSTEFLVRVRDLASNGFARIQQAGNSAFNSVHRSVLSTSQSLNRLPASVSELNRRLDELKRTRELSIDRRQIHALNREISELENRVERISGGGKSGGLSSIIPGGGMMALAAGAGLGFGAVMGSIMEDEMNLASLQVLTGSEQIANKLQAQIKDYALSSPYGSSAMVSNASLMKSFGISDGNIIPTLKMIGDVAMGDQQKMNSLTLAFSQMSATGRLTGQDLNQMINAGFNPLSILAKESGKGIAQLKEEMEKGAISAKDVARAFQLATTEGGPFFGMADKMGNTLQGKLNALAETALETGKSFLSNLVGPLTKLIDFAGFLLEFKTVVLTVGLGWLAYSQYQNVATFATRLFTGGLFTLRSALIASGVGAILVVVGLLIDLAMRVKNTTNGVTVLKTALIGFGTAVKSTFQIMVEHISFAMEKAWIKVKTFFGNVISQPGKVLEAVGYFATGRFDKGKEVMSSIFSSGDNGELKALESQHNSRLKTLQDSRSIGWNQTKTGFKNLYGGSGSTSSGGVLNLDDFNSNGGGADSLASAKDKADRTSAGGSRSITINIDKFQDAINIYASGVDQAVDDLDRRITETLLRVVNSAALVQ